MACKDLILCKYDVHVLLKLLCLPLPLTLVYFLAYSADLKMEATCSFETPFDFQQTIRRCIPEERTLPNYCCENLKSCTQMLLSPEGESGKALDVDRRGNRN
jgi:hypothetical protein